VASLTVEFFLFPLCSPRRDEFLEYTIDKQKKNEGIFDPVIICPKLLLG